VGEHVSTEERVGALLIELERRAPFGVVDKAASRLGIDVSHLARVEELVLCAWIGPEHFPDNVGLVFGVANVLLHLGDLIGGLTGARYPSVGTENGIIDQCTDGQLVKDPIGQLEDLQSILFAVVEHTFAEVGVFPLGFAHLMITTEKGDPVGAEQFEGDEVQRADQSPLATVHVVAEKNVVGRKTGHGRPNGRLHREQIFNVAAIGIDKNFK